MHTVHAQLRAIRIVLEYCAQKTSSCLSSHYGKMSIAKPVAEFQIKLESVSIQNCVPQTIIQWKVGLLIPLHIRN